MKSAVAFILLGFAQFLAAAEPPTAAAPYAAGVIPDATALDSMTPAELEQLRSDLEQQTAKAREESAALTRRVEELERLNAEAVARKAQLDAEYAATLERLTELERGTRRD